jgi:hypothetical protein
MWKPTHKHEISAHKLLHWNVEVLQEFIGETWLLDCKNDTIEIV